MVTIDFRAAVAEDLEALCALHNRAETFDGVPRVLDLDEMREDIDDERVVLATDVRIALRDGELAGYTYTYYLPSAERLERCHVIGNVDPDHRGVGVGRALLGWGMERATEQLRSSGNNLPKYVRVNSFDFIEPAHRLYRRMGFTPVRYFDELLRPLDDLPAPGQVAGVSIEPWPDDRDDEILAVNNTAFADHWGSVPLDADRWHNAVRGFGSRLDLSFIAVDDASGDVVSFCLNKRYEADDALNGRRDGSIEQLGTLAEWRGRGLASQLVIRSLHAFSAAGFTHAAIGVDSESPTGAARLYRQLGFEPLHRAIEYEIALDASLNEPVVA
ncbi:MAG TPA: GNAT family N-acetyltransferase [Ilumatobacteraceae bacterium]|nr:GNAT family N-acetyltransferase [Ilumatobacteraceae bacterium]